MRLRGTRAYSVTRRVRWETYVDCPRCEAVAGRPCWDRRYRATSGSFTKDTPCRDRPRRDGVR